MKKVINGKIYNTETAKLIADWNNRCNANDFHVCEESLYKTKKGQFFIQGSGGAMSKYARPCGANSVGGSCDIELLNEAEALDWCEIHNIDADIITENFKIQEG